MKLTVELEVGDVVYLNSDMGFDTPMTVESVNVCECGDEDVAVVWISEYSGDVKRETFPTDCLMCLD